jgi:L-rhamnose-H+ transport protein
MNPNPFLGVLLHAIGGLMAASFYIPYKKVKHWAWEVFWLAGGLFSWIIAPTVFALIIAPQSIGAIFAVEPRVRFWTYFFGVLWGIGGLTFGLSMRYLGIALGYAIALGFCAAFGTLMPPIFHGEFGKIIGERSGQVVLLGVLVCLVGIAISGMAGLSKERELPDEGKTDSIAEFNFPKGVLVAVFAGIMSACMAFAMDAGKPIGQAAVTLGTPDVLQNLPMLIVALLGGFTTNFIWCVILAAKNGTWRQFFSTREGSTPYPGDFLQVLAAWAWPMVRNYALCALAGVTWYLQFFFYGMGTTKMGKYNFSSWTIHMAAIIIFSTVWGIALLEWKGTSRRTHILIALGLAVLIGSTIVVGYGNYLGAH